MRPQYGARKKKRRKAPFSCSAERCLEDISCRTRTAVAMFCQQTKPRAGAQTKLFDEKVLVEGESCLERVEYIF